jgi:hypothetical protein
MTDPHFPSSAGSAVLTEIVDFFATKQEGLGDMWAHPDDFSSYGLDYRHRDGTQLWIDLEKDGVVHILWKPAGQEKPTTVKFGLIPNPAQREPVSAEKMLDLLQCSTCFRGDVCRIMPCACAQSLADAAQPPAAPVETKSAIDMIAACYEGLCPDGSSALDFEWARQRGYILPNNGSGKLSPAQCSAATGGDILRKFADAFRSGEQGATMDCDDAQKMALAIDSLLNQPQGARESREEYERGYADGIEWAITQGPQTPLKGDGQ